ncbi:Ig-like domain-containing protein [Ekhidna sp.]
MKAFKFLILIWLVGCIQTDLEDPFPPTIRIDNSINEIDFRVSGSYILSAIYTDDTGEPIETDAIWESSDENILSFNGNIATVHAEGTVIIDVATNGINDSHTVETLASRGSLLITGSVPVVQIGNSSPFKFNFIDIDGKTNNLESAIWSSSNESVATIDSNGTVEAVSAGTTTISLIVDGIGQTTNLEVITDDVTVDPAVRLLSFAQFLSVNNSFQFEADYLQSDGTVDESAMISWASTDGLSVDQNGLVTAVKSGTSIIDASFGKFNTSIEVTVEGDEISTRSGSLRGTGYDIEGDFLLGENEDGDLILTIENYKPDGPGPYFYLTNQDRNVSNGLNLGDAGTAGTVTINISQIDDTVEASTFDFLMIWCEPFNVRLGIGAFEN